MAGTQFSCPKCGSTLTFAQDVPAGATVRCPLCDTTFAALPAAPVPATVPPPPPAAKVPTAKFAAPTPRAAVATPPRPATTAPSARSAPRPAPVAAASAAGQGRLLGGLVLGAMALLLLGGLAALVYTQLLAGRGQDKMADGGPAPIAFTPTTNLAKAPADDGSKKSPVSVVTPKDEPKKETAPPTKPDDVDVADLKKPKAPPPETPIVTSPVPRPPPEPADKSDTPKKGGPTVTIVIPGTPAAPGVNAERVNTAIERGVRYLKERQQRDGTWKGGPDLGYAALCGLALLECQVPANDPAVMNAARFVRLTAPNRIQVYEISASILFLDRLGDKRDSELIRNLALRLLAYQNPAGGWGYTGAVVYPVDPGKMIAYLRTHFPWSPKRPAPAGKALVKPGAKVEAAKGIDKSKDAPAVDLRKLPPDQLLWNKWSPYMLNPGDNSNTQFALLALWAARRHGLPVECAVLLSYQRYLVTQNDDNGWGYAGPIALKGFPAPRAIPPGTPIPPGAIPPGFMPVGGGLGLPLGPMPPPGGARPGIAPPGGAPPGAAPPGGAPPAVAPPGIAPPGGAPPMGGGWGTNIATTPTMTCVGLLGMAMGQGAVPDGGRAADAERFENPAIQNGLRLLASHVGNPLPNAGARPAMQNLYLLWSVERVAVLYDLKTIGGKDWYGWGAQILLANQGGDGGWGGGGYTGATGISDTCFALLFLKRSNLMPDLTENLRLNMVIRDPGAK